MSYDIIAAVRALDATAEMSVNGESVDNIIWHKNSNNITAEQVTAKMAELKTDYDNKAYQRNRAVEYPALAEQFDLLFHAIDAGTLDKTSDFYTTLKTVKDKYPKG